MTPTPAADSPKSSSSGPTGTTTAPRTQVSWVEATGEIYAMRDPLGGLVADVIGDVQRRARCPTTS